MMCRAGSFQDEEEPREGSPQTGQQRQVKERDLTVSQIQQAYQNLMLDRAKAQNMILTWDTAWTK